MRTLLLIMNPRAIPSAIQSLSELKIDKAWMSYYTEAELETVIPSIINVTNYDRYTIISDDVIATQTALDEVLRLHDNFPNRVACGWTNLDAQYDLSTYHPKNLKYGLPHDNRYNFETMETARNMPDIATTRFHGMIFTTMNRELWKRYPFKTYNGCASDLHQCQRLQEDNTTIYTGRNTFVYHLKERRNQLDEAPEKQLLVGLEQPNIKYQTN